MEGRWRGANLRRVGKTGLSEEVTYEQDEKERRKPCPCWETYSRQGEQPVQRPCSMFEKQQGSQGGWSGGNERERRREVSKLRDHHPHHG